MNDKRTRAQELRAEGKLLREIVAELGVPRATVGAWLDPNHLEKQRKRRRERYSVPCEACGAPTDGSGGLRVHSRLCASCYAAERHETRRWTSEAVVTAIQRFADRYGRQPAASDFNPSFSRMRGHDWRAERFYTDGDYPLVPTVLREFGSWNAALEAAGFEARGFGATREMRDVLDRERVA